MDTPEVSQVLPYASPMVKAPRARNRLAAVALISVLVFNPCLRLAVSLPPFWTGHPCHWIQEIVESIPLLVLPLPGVILGASALGTAWLFNQRRALALAATIIGICWYVLSALAMLFPIELPAQN